MLTEFVVNRNISPDDNKPKPKLNTKQHKLYEHEKKINGYGLSMRGDDGSVASRCFLK